MTRFANTAFGVTLAITILNFALIGFAPLTA
jgi:hypothetical protein